MVEVKGLEPPAPWSQTMCATKLRYTSFLNGGEGGIRTLAPVTQPNPLAGDPLEPLEYFSIKSIDIDSYFFGGEEGIRTLVSRKTLTVFKTAPL